MHLQLSFEGDGVKGVVEQLAKLSGGQAREAYALALNDAAFGLQKAMRAEIRSAFDRPTAFIANSPKVFRATADRLSVRVIPTMDSRGIWSPGGKVGVDPQHVLQAQEWGGTRSDKRSEVALRRAGILPNGYQTAIPKVPFPGSDDGKGNLRGAFLAQLISYLRASGEQGYRANMTDRRKAAIHRGREAAGPLQPGCQRMTDGRRYFVAAGRLRSGRSTHLAAGIWAARGIQGVDVRPVVMFVKRGSYRPRISMERIAEAVQVQDVIERRLRYRIRQAAGV